jgi:hypothetical protein
MNTTTPTTTPIAPARGGATSPDAVTALLARWRREGTTFVVVDERGRHRDELAAGRLDLARAAAVDATWIDAVVHRNGFAHLDACHVPRERRPAVLGRALAAIQRLRARTGRPEWIVLEAGQVVLREPGLPPHALRTDDGGYCLAVRDGAEPPALPGIHVPALIRVSQPGLELSLVPPRTAGIP